MPSTESRRRWWEVSEVPPISSDIQRVMYVMKMGWSRWGTEVRRKWLYELRRACCETIEDLDKNCFGEDQRER